MKLDIYILCLDTSTNVCSVSIAKNGTVIASRSNDDYKSHTRMIMLLVEECVQASQITLQDINAISVASGPGSYTGLRIGASSAKGLCLGLDLPLIGINSLEILAEGVKEALHDDSIIVPAIDARRQEIYAQVYDYKGNELVSTTSIILTEPNILTDTFKDKTIHAIGNGASKVAKHYSDRTTLHALKADAAFMSETSYDRYTQGAFNNIVTFSPYYHKNPNIILSKKNIL